MTETIEEGETQQFTATAYDSDDMEIHGQDLYMGEQQHHRRDGKSIFRDVYDGYRG